MMGQISLNFWSPLAPKLLVGSKKNFGVQKLYGHALAACNVCLCVYHSVWHAWVLTQISDRDGCAHCNSYIAAVNWSVLMLFSAFFTARSSYASAVLGIIILSVRLSVCSSVSPSVTHVFCNETKEHTAEIFTTLKG